MEAIKSFFKKRVRVITIIFSVLLLFLAINATWIANNFYSLRKIFE